VVVRLASSSAAAAGDESALPAQHSTQHRGECGCACSCGECGCASNSFSSATSVGECCGCGEGCVGESSSVGADVVLQDLAALLAEVSACDTCCSCCQGV
jgi:hypothetical protein